MITVTERAAAELQEVLVAQQAPPGLGVKLVPNQMGGISMTIAPPAEGDEVVQRGDTPLLIVDYRISDAIDGMVLDAHTDEEDGQPRTQFTLQRPGALE